MSQCTQFMVKRELCINRSLTQNELQKRLAALYQLKLTLHIVVHVQCLGYIDVHACTFLQCMSSPTSSSSADMLVTFDLPCQEPTNLDTSPSHRLSSQVDSIVSQACFTALSNLPVTESNTSLHNVWQNTLTLLIVGIVKLAICPSFATNNYCTS